MTKSKCNKWLDLILTDIPKIITGCEKGYIITYHIHNGCHPKYARQQNIKEYTSKLNRVIGTVIDQVHLNIPNYCAALVSDARLPEFVLTLHPQHNKPELPGTALRLLPLRDAVRTTSTMVKVISDISYCAIPSSVSMEYINSIVQSDIKSVRVKIMGLAVCFFHKIGNHDASNTIRELIRTNSHNLLIQNTI